jgi:putative spermidine/putrescine transport system substrate-binding protein
MRKLSFLVAAAVLPLAITGAEATDLTIVSWGGAYSASQQKAYHEPYMAANADVKIINDDSANESVAKLRAMSEAKNLTWDLVDVEGPDAVRLCDEGLAMEIDHDEWLAPAPDGTSASADFGDTIVSPCFIPQIVFSTTFGYRTDMVGNDPPKDLCAIFDLQKYPGKRSLEKRPKKNLEWALLCDGVAKDDLYDVLSTDEGVAKALAKLDTIKSEVIWWSAGAETPQRLADGEVVMGSTYNGRLFSVIEEQKQPVAMLWDWQVFDVDGWIVPSGLSDEKLAAVKKYLRFATDTQRLADQAKFISYGPARTSSAPLVGKHADLGIAMAPHMPTDPANIERILLNNIEWWADNQDELEEKFAAWLTK